MANCPGKKRTGGICYGFVYRCKKCGSVGCEHYQDGECSNQGFKSGYCLRCGTLGQKEAVR